MVRTMTDREALEVQVIETYSGLTRTQWRLSGDDN